MQYQVSLEVQKRVQAEVCNPKIQNVHMVLLVGAFSKTGLGVFNIPVLLVFLMCPCDSSGEIRISS